MVNAIFVDPGSLKRKQLRIFDRELARHRFDEIFTFSEIENIYLDISQEPPGFVDSLEPHFHVCVNAWQALHSWERGFARKRSIDHELIFYFTFLSVATNNITESPIRKRLGCFGRSELHNVSSFFFFSSRKR